MAGTARRRTSSITGAQLQAARQLLGWTFRELAEAGGVSGTTTRSTMCPDRPLRATAATIDAIERTLAEAGVEFVERNGSGAASECKKGKLS